MALRKEGFAPILVVIPGGTVSMSRNENSSGKAAFLHARQIAQRFLAGFAVAGT